MRYKMNESVRHSKKATKSKHEKKHKKIVSKDKLSLKVNTLEVVTKNEKTDNIWPKATSSTELFSSFNIPDILVTPEKKDAINNKTVPPNAKRKFSGDKTSQDGELIEENASYAEASEERRIRTKSLPQPPSLCTANDFASAPLPVNGDKKEKEDATQELLNKKISIASKNDYVSALAPLSFPTISKLGAKSLIKSSLTITFSEPISVVSHELEKPKQIVDHQYVNNSPRQRSKSVTESITPEEDAGYLKNFYTSLKNTLLGKKVNEEEVVLHSHSQPQIVNPIKTPVILKQNVNPSNKSNLESKHTDHQSQKNLAPTPKHKIPDGAAGQKFKLPPQVSFKPNEQNTAPLKQDNKSALSNHPPLTTNLNKPVSKLGINPQNNSELENVKQQLYLQREQLHQLLEKNNQNLTKQDPAYPSSFSHHKSNKGSALNTIFQLVKATEGQSSNFNPNLTGTNDKQKELTQHHYIYDDDNNDH